MIQYRRQRGVQDGVTMAALVQQARLHGGGPTPRVGGGGGTDVWQGNWAVVTFGAAPQKRGAFPLITCAGVVLAGAARAAVYHAHSGDMPGGALAAMLAALGNPAPATLLAVYVTTDPWDDRYDADAMQLQALGIPPNNVVYAEKFLFGRFGINNHGHVGGW